MPGDESVGSDWWRVRYAWLNGSSKTRAEGVIEVVGGSAPRSGLANPEEVWIRPETSLKHDFGSQSCLGA